MQTESRVQAPKATLDDDLPCRLECPFLLITTTYGIVYARRAMGRHQDGNLGGQLGQFEWARDYRNEASRRGASGSKTKHCGGRRVAPWLVDRNKRFIAPRQLADSARVFVFGLLVDRKRKRADKSNAHQRCSSASPEALEPFDFVCVTDATSKVVELVPVIRMSLVKSSGIICTYACILVLTESKGYCITVSFCRGPFKDLDLRQQRSRAHCLREQRSRFCTALPSDGPALGVVPMETIET